MSIILNDNFNTQFPKPIDDRYGPYNTIAEALAAIPSHRRYIGLTIGIDFENVEEYWWKDGLLDGDLVAKFDSIPYPVRSVNAKTGDVVLDTDDINEGVVNQYFTAARVRAVLLTGLSTATNAIISATDSVLVAFGKLQAQITANLSTLTTHISNVSNPHSVTKSQVGLGNVDNTSDANKPISTATQTALNAKQNTITGGATTITTSNLTASRAVVSNASGKVAVSSVTDTELGYLSGVTSAIQTQLNGKQATLVSGTNIKTINGTSVLGSGDIVTSVQLSYRHDFNVYDYLGKAASGSSEGANVWTITRLTIASDGSVTKGTATNVNWTDRYTHIYS
jgi:hypothetical protein